MLAIEREKTEPNIWQVIMFPTIVGIILSTAFDYEVVAYQIRNHLAK